MFLFYNKNNNKIIISKVELCCKLRKSRAAYSLLSAIWLFFHLHDLKNIFFLTIRLLSTILIKYRK